MNSKRKKIYNESSIDTLKSINQLNRARIEVNPFLVSRDEESKKSSIRPKLSTLVSRDEGRDSLISFTDKHSNRFKPKSVSVLGDSTLDRILNISEGS